MLATIGLFAVDGVFSQSLGASASASGSFPSAVAAGLVPVPVRGARAAADADWISWYEITAVTVKFDTYETSHNGCTERRESHGSAWSVGNPSIDDAFGWMLPSPNLEGSTDNVRGVEQSSVHRSCPDEQFSCTGHQQGAGRLSIEPTESDKGPLRVNVRFAIWPIGSTDDADRCNPPRWPPWTDRVTRVPLPLARTMKLKWAGTESESSQYVNSSGAWLITATLTRACRLPSGVPPKRRNCLGNQRSLTAVPGGPYRVQRGMRVDLDGSRSRGKIKSYTWTFLPAPANGGPHIALTFAANKGSASSAPCPKGVQPQRGGKKGAKISVVALCDFTAKLTVSDGRKTKSQTANVTVDRRNWVTRPPSQPTLSRKANLGDLTAHPNDVPPVFGHNNPDCGDEIRPPELANLMFCPLPIIMGKKDEGRTWLERGYRLDQVHDKGGPYDTRWYVAKQPNFYFHREVVLNKSMYPDGLKAIDAPVNWYYENDLRDLDPNAWIETVTQHEGDGAPGVSHSGHTQAMIEELKQQPDLADPQRVIEGVIAPRRTDAQDEADQNLHAAGHNICNYQRNDNLTDLWAGRKPVVVWNGSDWVDTRNAPDPPDLCN